MATLTETAYYARNTVRWTIIGLIAFIILRITFEVAVSVIRSTFPAPPLKPNYAFGKLPKLIFPQTATPSADFTFSVQTIEGTVPQASEAAYVFFMPKNRVDLLSLSKTQSFVSRLNFTSSPQQIQDIRYRWVDLANPFRAIEVNIVDLHFTLSYAFQNDLSLFQDRDVPSSTQALNEVGSFLQTLGLDLSDLNFQEAKIAYLKLVGDTLTSTTSQSQADAVRIDVFRMSYEGIPVVTESPDTGIMTFILSGSRRIEKRFLHVNYRYWPVDQQVAAIYKLKTSNEAFEDLKKGNAYFVRLPTNQNRAAITNVRLAYYDGPFTQLYLQPVFIFEGENGFLAYVPAIAPPWIEE